MARFTVADAISCMPKESPQVMLDEMMELFDGSIDTLADIYAKAELDRLGDKISMTKIGSALFMSGLYLGIKMQESKGGSDTMNLKLIYDEPPAGTGQ
jgi:hypothetical protein